MIFTSHAMVLLSRIDFFRVIPWLSHSFSLLASHFLPLTSHFLLLTFPFSLLTCRPPARASQPAGVGDQVGATRTGLSEGLQSVDDVR